MSENPRYYSQYSDLALADHAYDVFENPEEVISFEIAQTPTYHEKAPKRFPTVVLPTIHTDLETLCYRATPMEVALYIENQKFLNKNKTRFD
jgi:hypothetical protein